MRTSSTMRSITQWLNCSISLNSVLFDLCCRQSHPVMCQEEISDLLDVFRMQLMAVLLPNMFTLPSPRFDSLVSHAHLIVPAPLTRPPN
jgi:hypothetical protein